MFYFTNETIITINSVVAVTKYLTKYLRLNIISVSMQLIGNFLLEKHENVHSSRVLHVSATMSVPQT